MLADNVVQFPMRNPGMFSRDINNQVLSAGEYRRLLCAAIRALPHIKDVECREELKGALCDLLLPEDGVA